MVGCDKWAYRDYNDSVAKNIAPSCRSTDGMSTGPRTGPARWGFDDGGGDGGLNKNSGDGVEMVDVEGAGVVRILGRRGSGAGVQ